MAGKSTEYQWLLKLGAKIDSSFGKAMKGAGTAIKSLGVATAGIVAGAAAAGKQLYDLGNSYREAANGMAAATGATAEELAGLQQSMQRIYAANFGEDVTDVGDALATATQNTGLMGEELETLTKNALMLRDTFDYDVAESTRAANALMENFGISGEEAMNLIASGAQNGLDFSGEFIDTINEYSVQFAKLGMDAEDMFAIMQSGADGTAWNLDKVGDTIKEFSIRAIDGSDGTKKAFAAIGMDADAMMQTIAAGGAGANEAFYDVLNGLLAIEDPVARDAAGVQLMGTTWEDMGVEAVRALADTEDAAYDAGDALKKIENIRYKDFGAMMEGLKRQVQVALLPAATSLIGTLTDMMPVISEMVSGITPMIEQLAPMLTSILQALLPMAEQVFPVLIEAIQLILPVITDLVEQLMPIVTQLLPPMFELFSAAVPLIAAIAEVVTNVLAAALNALSPIVEGVTSVFSGLLSFLTDVFSGNWEAVWTSVVGVFESILRRLRGSSKASSTALFLVLTG